jgi:hypothetical protein
MKRYRFAAILIVLALVSSSVLRAQVFSKALSFGPPSPVQDRAEDAPTTGLASQSRPGSSPYTPTRLEWLTVELNAFARIQTLATERFTLMFTPRPTDDTIVVYVRYLPNVNQNDLRGAIREARNIINIIAKRHGWDGWVSVVEDVAAM